MTFLLKKRNHITVRFRPPDVPSPSVFRVKFKVLHLGLKAIRGSFSASARTTLLTTLLSSCRSPDDNWLCFPPPALQVPPPRRPPSHSPGGQMARWLLVSPGFIRLISRKRSRPKLQPEPESTPVCPSFRPATWTRHVPSGDPPTFLSVTASRTRMRPAQSLPLATGLHLLNKQVA